MRRALRLRNNALNHCPASQAEMAGGSGWRSRVVEEMHTCSVRATAARLSAAPVFQST